MTKLMSSISDTISLALATNRRHTSSVTGSGLRTESGGMETVKRVELHMKSMADVASAIADPADLIDLRTPSAGGAAYSSFACTSHGLALERSVDWRFRSVARISGGGIVEMGCPKPTICSIDQGSPIFALMAVGTWPQRLMIAARRDSRI